MRISDWSSDVCSSDLPYADQTGQVPVRVEFPDGVTGVLRSYVGLQEWIWTANFEAYGAFPARLGSTPPGRYRFCVEGRSRQSFAFVPYAFCSNAFVVAPWHGLAVKNLVTDSSGVRFDSDLRSEEHTSALQQLMRNS